MTSNSTTSAILLMHCPDQIGLVAAVTDFIQKNNGNILHLDQHVDDRQNVFFMRLEWDLDGFAIPRAKVGEFFKVLIGDKFNMAWELHFSDERPRMALFVSKLPHCLYDILARWHTAEWPVEIPLIISNHDTLRPIAERYGIDFHHIPITKATKPAQEAQELDLLREYDIDFIVLARYMQILSADFVSHFPNRIINIHHSFLPAFAGARPYHSAYKRGVKLIGATSHYVTAELDAGPIIEQDVVRVSHRHDVRDLVRKGRDLEKMVLSRAIFHHLRHRVLVYGNRTLVFS